MSLDHHLFGLTSDLQWLPVRVNASGHVAMVDQPADAADVEPVEGPWSFASPPNGISDTSSYAIVGAPATGKRSYLASLQAQNTSSTATELVVRSGTTVLWRVSLQASMIAPRSFRFQKPLRSGLGEILNVMCLTTGTRTYVNAQGYQDRTRTDPIYTYDSLAAALLGSEPAGVAIDFRDGSVVVRDTTTPANSYSGDVNSWLTYTSPSTKGILGANGLYSSGTTLRTEYDSSGTALGVRIEPAATNLLLRNTELDVAPWTALNVSISADSATSPDGATSAELITATGASVIHAVNQVVTLASATTYTYSGFFKAGVTDRVGLLILDSLSAGTVVKFHLNDQTFGTNETIGAGLTVVSRAIESVGNGWYRCSCTVTTAAVTVHTLYVYALNSADARAYVPAGTPESLYAWGLQVEIGLLTTSPIVTAGSTATRAADLILKSGTDYPSLNSGGTILAAYRLQQVSAAARIAQLYNATGPTDYTDMYCASSVLEGFADAGNIATTGTKTLTANTLHKSAHRFITGSQSMSLNGAISHADTRAMTVAFNRLAMGHSGASGLQQLNGHLQYFVALPRQLSNSELNTRTAP